VNGNFWNSQETKPVNRNCIFPILVATVKINTLESFKSNENSIKIKGKSLKY
jgi:hypothetical protein